MGGIGSTRWDGHIRKTTVEECLVLSVGDVLRSGVVSEHKLTQMDWVERPSGNVLASVFYKLDLSMPGNPAKGVFA